MFTISKEFSFCASHTLMGLPEEHPCSRLHGHNYTVIVEFQSSTLDEVGFILDYREMDPIKVYIDRMLDHKHLNDVYKLINPTAELLAEYLFHVFQSIFEAPHRSQLSAVTVKETPATAARYEPK